MDWLGLIVIAAGVIVCVVAALIIGTTRYRYRITVEVETLQGIVAGSSVCEVGFPRLFPFGLPLTM